MNFMKAYIILDSGKGLKKADALFIFQTSLFFLVHRLQTIDAYTWASRIRDLSKLSMLLVKKSIDELSEIQNLINLPSFLLANQRPFPISCKCMDSFLSQVWLLHSAFYFLVIPQDPAPAVVTHNNAPPCQTKVEALTYEAIVEALCDPSILG